MAKRRLPPKPRAARRGGLIAAVVLLAVVLAAYSNSYQSGWVLDNQSIVHVDPRLRDASWTNVRLIFSEDYWYPRFESGLYRPVTTLTYLVNATLAGGVEDPAPFHVVNNLLHALNALLVFLLCRRLTGRLLPAFGAGLIFATHPIATEAVTNVIGRADLLATMAVLGGTLIYARIADGGMSARRTPALLAALFLVAVAGLLSKESAVALVGVVVVYDWTRGRWPGRAVLVFLPVVLVVAVMRHAVLAGTVPNMPFVDNPLRGAGFIQARLTAIEILGRQLWLLVWPHRLSSDYNFNQIPVVAGSLVSVDGLAALISLAVVAGLILLAMRSRASHPALSFFVLFLFVAYLPTSNLIVLIGSNMAERFMYMPLAGFAALAGIAIELVSRLISTRRSTTIATAAIATMCVALGIRTWQRNKAWVDDLSLGESTAAASPDSFSAHEYLAAAMYQANPARIDAVIAEAERGIEILDPLSDEHNIAEPYVRLATYYVAVGAFDKARGVLERARTIDQTFNRRHRELARQAGHADDAIADLGLPALYDLLAVVYQHFGDEAQARAAAEQARHLRSPLNK